MKVLLAAMACLALSPRAGCGCKAVLITEITPSTDFTLPVGGESTITVKEGGCGELHPVGDARFVSTNEAIARVDSLTGSVTALRVGDAAVWVGRAVRPSSAGASQFVINVHVR